MDKKAGAVLHAHYRLETATVIREDTEEEEAEPWRGEKPVNSRRCRC